MGRPSKIWQRGDRGYFCTVAGKQIPLGHDYDEALKQFHRLKGNQSSRTKAPRITDLINLYLDEKHTEVKPITHRGYVSILQSFASYKPIKSLRYEDLRAHHVKAWLASGAWSANTRQKNACRVRTWSGWVIESGYADADYIGRLRVKGGKPRQPAPPGVLEKIIDACEPGSAIHDLLVLLYDTGCRPGELRALEASTINWESSEALVSGKTGPRVVGLTRRSLDILRRCRLKHPDGPILRTGQGHAWAERHVSKSFRVVADPLGFTSVTCYSFRHALAGRWSAAGISDMVVAKQLGHVRAGRPSTDMTIRTYLHLHESELAKAANMATSPTPSLPQSPAAVASARRAKP